MYDEADLLPISAFQHLAFCERQWALIHLEGLWAENRLTVEGHHLHERTHQSETESRGDLRIARGLRLRSLRLGLSGIADVVEFRRVAGALDDHFSPPDQAGVRLPGARGLWQPAPVEYRGGSRSWVLTMRYSFARRRCAWKKCSGWLFPPPLCTTASHASGKRCRLPSSCASKQKSWQRACTS